MFGGGTPLSLSPSGDEAVEGAPGEGANGEMVSHEISFAKTTRRGLSLLAGVAVIALAGVAAPAAAQDGKLPPILILPGEAPQTVTEGPTPAPAPQQPAAAPAEQPTTGDAPAVVISPAPSAPPPAPVQPQEAAKPADAEEDGPAVVISPAPGAPPPPPNQPTAAEEPEAEDEGPAVVISPAPGAPPPAPQPGPQTAQEEATPPLTVLPDEEAVNPGGETSSEDPSGDEAADQSEDMEPVGSTTQVLYAPDGVDVPIDSQETLEELAEQLKQRSNTRVQLYGYATSPDGSENAARRLSLERAQAVRGFLVDRGVAVSRFTIRPQGIATDGGPADRVDIVLTGQ